jgi:hypothetical protein
MLAARLLGDTLKASAIGLAIGAALFALFTLANYHSIGRDVQADRSAISAAFASGSLGDEDWRRGDTQIGQHQFNDCLILQMAIDQRPPRRQLMVSPSWPTLAPPEPACRDLRRLIGGETPSPHIAFYHRYVHGQVMLVRTLLPTMSIDAIRALFRFAVAGVILLGLAVSLAALVAGRRMREGLVWLIVFLAFARFFGIEAFGQSLGHGPSDLIVLLFALMLAVASVWRGLSDGAVMPLAAMFGGATMIFELLTGGIPLGLALLIGGLPFALRGGDGARPCWQAVWRAVVAFSAAIAACVVLKLALIVQVFGREGLSGIGQQLAVRMGVGANEGGADLGPVRFAVQILKGMDGLVPGMREFAALVIALAVASGAWGLWRIGRSADPRLRTQACLLAGSNIVLPVWLIAFREHSMAHSWFMDRILVWTVASGFALFALALVDRSGRAVQVKAP